ncbi:hypothetical protein [Streptomyces sp. NPDC101132]|uniref:hypothetical protein n=1 Tax=Streptomyces sp. NPDC101132 TaxID=3366110 RepID=UPI0037FE2B3B
MNPPSTPPPPPSLGRALDRVAETFRGMTARADETQCDCHWGSAEELALLKVPDVELDGDLLDRTWCAPDWDDHGAVLRRILPQLARELAAGRVDLVGRQNVGTSFARGGWRDWPAGQATVVWEFLHAWWARVLTDPESPYPAHEALVVCAQASGTLTPWLAAWEALDGPVADRHLAEVVRGWDWDLLRDELPWRPWEDEEEDALRTELRGWLVRHVPARLRGTPGHEEVLHRARLLGLTGPARWEDPHWPADLG